MKKYVLFVSFSLFLMMAHSQNEKPGCRIMVNDPSIHKLIPENARIELLAEGHQWTEGPLWLEKQEKLIYSDIPQNAVFEWSEKGGKKIYLKPSGYTGDESRQGEGGSNGLIIGPGGKLILCQHGDRRIALMNAPVSDPEPEFTTIAGSYNGKKLNSPNDAVLHKNGDIYFTDPPYGLEKGTADPARELDFQGVFKTSKNGETVLLTKELSRPNGIAFSPGFDKLYVANSDPQKALWMVYDLDENGMAVRGKVFYDVTSLVGELKGLPDGMKVHPVGWVFATGPGGVLVFNPEGKHLGTIFTGEATANCAFDSNYSYLYMTADDYLLRIKLNGF